MGISGAKRNGSGHSHGVSGRPQCGGSSSYVLAQGLDDVVGGHHPRSVKHDIDGARRIPKSQVLALIAIRVLGLLPLLTQWWCIYRHLPMKLFRQLLDLPALRNVVLVSVVGRAPHGGTLLWCWLAWPLATMVHGMAPNNYDCGCGGRCHALIPLLDSLAWGLGCCCLPAGQHMCGRSTFLQPQHTCQQDWRAQRRP
jgi:hypothetical protein